MVTRDVQFFVVLFMTLTVSTSLLVDSQPKFSTFLEQDGLVLRYGKLEVTLGRNVITEFTRCLCEQNSSGCIVETNQTAYLFDLIPSYRLHATRTIAVSEHNGDEHRIKNCSLTLMNNYYLYFFGILQCPAAVSTYSLDVLITVFDVHSILAPANQISPNDQCALTEIQPFSSTKSVREDFTVSPTGTYFEDISISPTSSGSPDDISVDDWNPDDRNGPSLDLSVISSNYVPSSLFSSVSENFASRSTGGTGYFSAYVFSQIDRIQSSYPVQETATREIVSATSDFRATPTISDSALPLSHTVATHTSYTYATPSSQLTSLATSPAPTTSTSTAAVTDNNSVMIIIICCVVLVLLCIVVIIIFIISSRRRSSMTRNRNDSLQTLTSSS